MSLSVMLCPAFPPSQLTLLPIPGSSITKSLCAKCITELLVYKFTFRICSSELWFCWLGLCIRVLLCSVDFVSFNVPVCFFLVSHNTHKCFILFLVKIMKPSFTSCDTFSGAVSLLCSVLYVCIFSRWNVFYFIIKSINCYLFNSWLSSEVISAQSHISFHSLLVVTQVLFWILGILESWRWGIGH
jgi:hypothetical protein